jgi:hypothetical protein
VGHDFGSPVAAWCALVRPDVFQSVVLMSAPFPGPPSLPFNTASGATDSRAKAASSGGSVHEQLARLDPPRKHYQWYYSTREANADMHDAPQGVHDFLRAYYHYKSADWARNNPVALKSFTAGELAKLPTYYIMELHKGMAATVAPEMPSPAEIASCRWLTEQELKVYSTEYLRTGFQLVSVPYTKRRHRRARIFFRPADRSAFALHRRQEGLGHLSGARQHRAHATQRMHTHAVVHSGGGRRALGAAGAAAASVRIIARVSAVARSLTAQHRRRPPKPRTPGIAKTRF